MKASAMPAALHASRLRRERRAITGPGSPPAGKGDGKVVSEEWFMALVTSHSIGAIKTRIEPARLHWLDA
jgi:hypothetical protein